MRVNSVDRKIRLLLSLIEFMTNFKAVISDNFWSRIIPASVHPIQFYTVGLTQDNYIGSGVYSKEIRIGKSFLLPDYCSVFRAELVATHEAVSCLRSLILSDNRRL